MLCRSSIISTQESWSPIGGKRDRDNVGSGCRRPDSLACVGPVETQKQVGLNGLIRCPARSRGFSLGKVGPRSTLLEQFELYCHPKRDLASQGSGSKEVSTNGASCTESTYQRILNRANTVVSSSRLYIYSIAVLLSMMATALKKGQSPPNRSLTSVMMATQVISSENIRTQE